MKIGIFDSGLGGLIVAKAIRKKLPQYDYVYLGDTKNVPYGNRSEKNIFELTRNAVDHLFRNENCALVITACNTASARALRKIQITYMKENFPKVRGEKFYPRILGVIIPAVEEAVHYKKVGNIATRSTVNSHTFVKEIMKRNKKIKVSQRPAPLLVPLIEEGDNKLAQPFIEKYLKNFKKEKIDALILGCTHYPILKREIKNYLGKDIKIISQDDIVPKKLKEYLSHHKEIRKKLSQNKKVKILVTDKTPMVGTLTKRWFGNIKPRFINLI